MKMKSSLFALVLTAVFFGGCVVQCLNPLFAEKDYIAVPGLAGTWVQKEGETEQGTWVFVQEAGSYKLTHTDEGGRKATFKVAAGRLGTNVFLNSVLDDLTPGTKLNDIATVHLAPTCTFIKLRKTDAGLTLVAMNLEWLGKLLAENPKAVTHTLRSYGNDTLPLLTASTEELQKFVARYAEDETAFGNKIKLVRKGAK